MHFVVLRVGLGKPSEISVPYLREPRVEFARLLRGKRLPAGVVGTAVNRGGPSRQPPIRLLGELKGPEKNPADKTRRWPSLKRANGRPAAVSRERRPEIWPGR